MRRLLLAVCSAVLVTLLHVSLAGACINDSETVRTEREFKKHYEFKSGYKEQAPVESPAGKTRWVPIAATWSGIGSLVGAVALVTLNVRKLGRE